MRSRSHVSSQFMTSRASWPFCYAPASLPGTSRAMIECKGWNGPARTKTREGEGVCTAMRRNKGRGRACCADPHGILLILDICSLFIACCCQKIHPTYFCPLVWICTIRSASLLSMTREPHLQTTIFHEIESRNLALILVS